MSRFAFSFDVTRCSGCMACIVACKDQNDLYADDTVAFRHVAKLESGAYPSARIDYFSLSCRHCGDAPCIIACPTAAIRGKVQDGAVVLDRDPCAGCHACELACPYGAPLPPADERVARCDLCCVRSEHVMKPACVLVCPSGALDAGPIEEMSARKAEEASVKILKSPIATPPDNG